MFDISDIRHIHLELSSYCNARCPQCPRNFFGLPYQHNYRESNLSLADLQKLLPEPMVSNLDEILVNGNHGDFMMNPHSVDILDWFRGLNPTLSIKICTNGGIRRADFWQALAGLDPEISFCIDGIGATHSIYRQDTEYQQVLENARVFIHAGGRAVWLMTEFEHNRHQFHEAEKIALQEGFQSFVKRPTFRDQGPVFDRAGRKVFVMKGQHWSLPDQIDQSVARDWMSKADQSRRSRQSLPEIACESKTHRSIFINSEGQIMPCCYLGLSKQHLQAVPQWPDSIGTTSLNQSLALFDKIENLFGTNPLDTCARTCSS